MLSAVRDRLYSRMEETSFRTSMTILAGVVALAAVIAVAGILLSRSPAATHPSALGRPPGAGPASVTPTSARATPTRTVSPSSAPSRAPSHRSPSPAGNTSDAGADAAAGGPAAGQPASDGTAGSPGSSGSSGRASSTPPKASRTWPSRSQIAAWWAWWSQHRGEFGGHGRYPGGGSGPRWGRGRY